MRRLRERVENGGDKKCCVVNEPKGNNREGVKSGDKAAEIKEGKGGV